MPRETEMVEQAYCDQCSKEIDEYKVIEYEDCTFCSHECEEAYKEAERKEKLRTTVEWNSTKDEEHPEIPEFWMDGSHIVAKIKIDDVTKLKVTEDYLKMPRTTLKVMVKKLKGLLNEIDPEKDELVELSVVNAEERPMGIKTREFLYLLAPHIEENDEKAVGKLKALLQFDPAFGKMIDTLKEAYERLMQLTKTR
jgi:hypothetical protein